MNERRKHKRYAILYPIERENGNAVQPLTLRDVSKGGVAFTVKEELRENERIDLQLFLKNRMFQLGAVVVHVEHLENGSYRIGAQFTDPPKEFFNTLEKETEEVTQFHRECNLYNHKSLQLLHGLQ